MATFGETLRRIRTEKGLTLAELGAAGELSTAFVSYVELGERSPLSVESCVRIANRIGLSDEELGELAILSVGERAGVELNFRADVSEAEFEKRLLFATLVALAWYCGGYEEILCSLEDLRNG